jgi:hypothetical protein
MKVISVSTDELEKLREKSLSFYNNQNVFNLSPESYWGKCVLLATCEMLAKKGIELQVEFPSTYPFQVKS